MFSIYIWIDKKVMVSTLKEYAIRWPIFKYSIFKCIHTRQMKKSELNLSSFSVCLYLCSTLPTIEQQVHTGSLSLCQNPLWNGPLLFTTCKYVWSLIHTVGLRDLNNYELFSLQFFIHLDQSYMRCNCVPSVKCAVIVCQVLHKV